MSEFLVTPSNFLQYFHVAVSYLSLILSSLLLLSSILSFFSNINKKQKKKRKKKKPKGREKNPQNKYFFENILTKKLIYIL